MTGGATVPVEAEVLAAALGRHQDYRVLRRLTTPTPAAARHAARAPVRTGCAIDVETTGLDPGACRIIELGLQRFEFDADGLIISIDEPCSWLEDPGEPLDPTIVALTGLTDADLAGRSIDDAAATALLASADVIVCHNAAFDRPFVERRLPAAVDLAWACSMREVDWRSHGFEGRSLGQLLWQCGAFHEAHRAADDVAALIALLRYRLGDGRTVLADLIERAERPGWIVDAVGAPFAAKDALKARGYRWNAKARHWSREVNDDQRADEMAWLGCHIYGDFGAPRLRPVDWRERHRG
jgi:DNA polymerase-3 subunit epsilon